MESRKKKNITKIDEPQELGYENLLEAFSLKDEEDKPGKKTGGKTFGSGDPALEELLADLSGESVIPQDGENAEKAAQEKPEDETEYESGDYSFLKKDIPDAIDTAPFDTADTPNVEEAAPDSSDTGFEKPEFVIEDNQSGYSSLLGELVDEETEEPPSSACESETEIENPDLKPETVTDFDRDKTADEGSLDRKADGENAANVLEASELPPLDEPEDTSVTDASAETVIPEKTNEEPIPEEEHDFLGLSGITTKAEKAAKQNASRTDVLFDGVEMDFDEQVDSVTRAELLLAQGKRKEAADIFHQLSEKKGVTHWVNKRIRLMSVTDN